MLARAAAKSERSEQSSPSQQGQAALCCRHSGQACREADDHLARPALLTPAIILALSTPAVSLPSPKCTLTRGRMTAMHASALASDIHPHPHSANKRHWYAPALLAELRALVAGELRRSGGDLDHDSRIGRGEGSHMPGLVTANARCSALRVRNRSSPSIDLCRSNAQRVRG